MTIHVPSRRLRLSPRIEVRLRHIGAEQQPLLVIDNVLDDPEAMIAAARTAGFYTPEHTHYPGVNAPLPEAYCQAVVTALRGPIEAAFGLSQSVGLNYFGFFAMATTPAVEAAPIQKLPHHDSADPGRLAMVHYLCHPPFRGTAFFRHKATGFESVDAVRLGTFLRAAERELTETASGPEAFARRDMAHFEAVGEAELKFNRLIIYRGHVLHSGLLDNDGASADPGIGRLTANGFIEAAGP